MDDLIEMFCDVCGTVTVHVDGENQIECTLCAQGDPQSDDFDSIEQMKEEEFESGVEGIDNWDEWN